MKTSDMGDVMTEFRSATFRHNVRAYSAVMLREAPHNSAYTKFTSKSSAFVVNFV